MKWFEHKEIYGYIVKKEGHPRFRNRDGYASVCYTIFANEEDMNAHRNILGRAPTVADAKLWCKWMRQEENA
jgi:hypothetical protein